MAENACSMASMSTSVFKIIVPTRALTSPVTERNHDDGIASKGIKLKCRNIFFMGVTENEEAKL